MRTWSVLPVHSPVNDEPMPSSMQKRGLCLMAIEFLSHYPAGECVVTSWSLPFWDTVFDLFPKTLFQVFCCPVMDPPRPNVICHNTRFDSQLAARFGARGAPYNLIFTAEDMETQARVYEQARPAAALLMMTQPARDYLEGDLVWPLYSSQLSGLCCLIPSPGPAKAVPYAGYYRAMREFHARPQSDREAYDRGCEDGILRSYARSIAGVGADSAELVVEMTRNALPPLGERDVVFWEPPPMVDLPGCELEALITAALESLQAEQQALMTAALESRQAEQRAPVDPSV